MNIVYASDENYAQHMAVSMVSLFENNREADEIRIFVVANEISGRTIARLKNLETKYGRTIEIIDFTEYKNQLRLNMEWPISVSSYSRLFLPEMLPADCDRVIYLDCDTVVCDSLAELWRIDLRSSYVAGVIDCVLPQFKTSVGLDEDEKYFNTGVLLIDLKKWREDDIQQKFMQFIDRKQGRVSHHDQGTINGVLHGRITELHPKYNAMTPMFTTRYENLIYLYRIKGGFYSKDEITQAVKAPVILHFVPEFVGRVWQKDCTHPKKKVYNRYLSMTDWKGNIQPSQNKKTIKQHLIEHIQCRWPIGIQKRLFR